MNKEKTKLFTMRIPLSKYEQLKGASAHFGMPISKMLLASTFAKFDETDFKPVPKKRKDPKRADPELLRQVAGMGNNLNQIARKLNEGEKIEVLPHLVNIEAKLDELIDLHNKYLETRGEPDAD
jgi:hypothetical protein